MTADPAALAAIHAAAFTMPRPWTAAEIAALIASPGAFLCTETGGFLIGRVVVDEAELLTVAVRPDVRRKGIANRLVAEFLREAQTRSAASAFLEVAADNLAARALYARIGFAEAGRRPRYYVTPDGKSIDALILSRPLGPGSGDS